MKLHRFLLLAALLAVSPSAATAGDSDHRLNPWVDGVKIAPVSKIEGRHSIHSYYVNNPESPDGKRVVFFTSTHPAGYIGEVRMIERATGKETVLAENVHTEDAHRAACQQWIAGGKLVAYHEVIDKKWRVVVVNVETVEKTVVAEDRQVGFGQPTSDLLPMYGCHWNPGPYRDLYVWDARTGKISTPLKIDAVRDQHVEFIKSEFFGKDVSVFFPVLSPDGKRAFFKFAAGNGGDDYMSKGASKRQGIAVVELDTGKMPWFRPKWGHPAWYPDSQRIFEMGNLTFDIAKPATDYGRVPNVPVLRGTHPSISPDGRLMVTDGLTDTLGGPVGQWGIQVADLRGDRWVMIHRFDQTKGAKSWRRSDPHPVFSADSRRIYYNVSDGEFTRLMVAEAAGGGK